jgi:hypothetical protein
MSGRAGCGRRSEMPVEECKHLVPPVERLFGAIGGPRGVEKGVACLGSSTMTLPPQQSTAASMPSSEQAAR